MIGIVVVRSTEIDVFILETFRFAKRSIGSFPILLDLWMTWWKCCVIAWGFFRDALEDSNKFHTRPGFPSLKELPKQ